MNPNPLTKRSTAINNDMFFFIFVFDAARRIALRPLALFDCDQNDTSSP